MYMYIYIYIYIYTQCGPATFVTQHGPQARFWCRARASERRLRSLVPRTPPPPPPPLDATRLTGIFEAHAARDGRAI